VKNRLLIFAAALFVRGFVLYHLYLDFSSKYWGEPASIARSLVMMGTFGGVYGRPEPTAWLAPGYPALVALVFALCGIATATAAKVLLVLNGIFSAVTAVATYELGKAVVSETAGLIAGWAWALSGYVASVSFLIWDTTASTLLLVLAVLLTLRNWYSTRSSVWILLGSSWGIAALFSPAVLAPFAVLLLYFSCKGRMRPALLAAVACALVLVPWSIRNWKQFHQFFVVRDNMWAEIYFGNAGYALHPMGRSGEYQKMGEVPFLKMLKERTITWIASHPSDFLAMTASRALRFWTYPSFVYGTLPVSLGLLGMVFALHRLRSSALPLLLILMAYPLVYYMSVVFSRFRYLIDPIVYILAGYALQRLVELARVALPRVAEKTLSVVQRSSETAS